MVKTRGYWVVRIIPEEYPEKTPFTLQVLEAAVKNSSVAIRGWDFPHIDTHKSPIRAPNHIEQPFDWQHYLELWRAYRSGQFVSLCGLWNDWRDKSTFWPPDCTWKSGTLLGVEDTVFRAVEIYEFAARWSTALGLTGRLTIDMKLQGLTDRALGLGPNRVPFMHPHVCSVQEWTFSESYSATALLAETRSLAVPPVISLFELFGWDVSKESIRGIQADFRK
jgi:hypothetical protein